MNPRTAKGVTLDTFKHHVQSCPIIASVQASPQSPLDDPQTLLRLAQASIQQGVQVLRLQGIDNIRTIRQQTKVPTIGLIKREVPGSPVYITPTVHEVDALLELGVEIIALDGTRRTRPNNQTLPDLIARIHRAGRLAMADCDEPNSVLSALESGADLIGSTLAGYTESSPKLPGPDLEFLRIARRLTTKPILAEGRYQDPNQVRTALAIGANAVVIGGSLNDPVKQTRLFLDAIPKTGRIGAVDLGGTWMRFGVWESGQWIHTERQPLHPDRSSRLTWIRDCTREHRVTRLGISTGGTVDPETGTVVEAKPLIPNHISTVFTEETLGVPTVALNDGLATAWAHGMHPDYAGKRVITLALGTGVGCGWVENGRLHMDRHGNYPRLNDLPWQGQSIEDAMGGASIAEGSTDWAVARSVLRSVVHWIQALLLPEVILIGGGVGLSRELENERRELHLIESPFGENAGLEGALALVRYPIPPAVTFPLRPSHTITS